MPDGGDEGFAHLGERLDVDAGGHAFAVEEVDEVVGADVAGGARRERAAAESAHGRVEVRDPQIEGGDDVGHPEVIGVVEVEVDGLVREGLEDRRGVATDQRRVRVADGVGDPDSVSSGVDEGTENLDEVVRLGDSVEGADETHCGRDVEAQSLVTGENGGVHEAIGGLGDGGVGVRLRVPFGGREHEFDVLGACVDGPLSALEVEDEGIELDSIGLVGSEAAQQLVGVGHLRDLLRIDEGADLDVLESRADELLCQGDLDVGGHDRFFDLQPVAQSGVEDVDGSGPDHGTPSRKLPLSGKRFVAALQCAASFSLYIALSPPDRLCSVFERTGRIACAVSRLSGTWVFESVRLDRVASFELGTVDEFQVDDITQSGEEVRTMAGDAGVDDELEFVDEAEFGERERQRHSPCRESPHGLFLEFADGGFEVSADELGVPVDAVQGARDDKFASRIDGRNERVEVRLRGRVTFGSAPGVFHHLVGDAAEDQAVGTLEIVRMMAVEFLADDSHAMIAAAVDGDVDRVPQLAHGIRVDLGGRHRKGLSQAIAAV